jgi:hypothetical protein
VRRHDRQNPRATIRRRTQIVNASSAARLACPHLDAAIAQIHPRVLIRWILGRCALSPGRLETLRDADPSRGVG